VAYARESGRLRDRSRALSWARTAVFLAASGLFLTWDLSEAPGRAIYAAAGMVGLLAFVALVGLHRRVRRERGWYDLLESICHEGLRRLDRKWSEIPGDPDGPAPAEHPYAGDLGVVGPASLMQLLGTVATRPGRERLRGWLLGLHEGTGGREVLRRRHAALRELGPLGEFRDRLTAHGRQAPDPGAERVEAVLAWAGDEDHEALTQSVVWAARLLPLVTLSLIWVEWVRPGPQRAWVIPLVAGFFLLGRSRVAAQGLFAGAGAGEATLDALAPLMEHIETLEPDAPLLKDLRESFGHGDDAASVGFRRLRFWNSLAESRMNQFYFPFNVLLLADIHVAWGLVRWRRTYGASVRRWVESLAELDALAALATLVRDNPAWTWPELDPLPGPADPPRIVARGLGHPLLPPSECVANDLEVGPPGTFVLVTGSNMSGKSTLLRAVGVNAVLAGIGAPVFADSLRLPVVRIATCMRVEDSLEQGVSLFRAELDRLKAVVDAAGESGGGPLLYLLDEILLGTNTAERQIAARRVLARLAALPVLGAVSTHDLDLADTSELRSAAQPVHFQERVEEGAGGVPLMHFDYRLHPGIATSTNALTLLRIVGLDAPPGGGSTG
jgi:hypothetical protein